MAYESIPTILTPQELMDKAYGRAAKIEKPDREVGHRNRKTTLAQLEAVRNILDDAMARYIKRFPSLDQIPPYHQELIRLLIGEDSYRMNLGAVDRARNNLIGILNRAMQEVGRQTDTEVLKTVKRRTYGRVSSVLNALERPLQKLAEFRRTLKRLPTVEPGLFTVVIAGYPNVGKSSLIRALTNAEPEVAAYPFTTKAANVGHMEIERESVRFSEATVRIQLIDTPGLLDRPQAERNAIEHQASLAIRHLADLVIFLRDPTGHCGYPVGVQENLLHEVRDLLGEIPLVVAESKADIPSQGEVPADLETARFAISTTVGTGIDGLVTFLVERATAKAENDTLVAYLEGRQLVSYHATPDGPVTKD